MMINLVGLIGEALTFRQLAASLAPEFKDEIEQGIAISKPILWQKNKSLKFGHANFFRYEILSI